MTKKAILRLPLWALLFLTNKLSELPKRNKNKWVFGSHWKRFKDNPKFLMLYVVENHPEIRCIWISHNKKDVGIVRSLGLDCYYWLSIKGAYHCITAGVYIGDNSISDINDFFAGNALFLDLHHGVGLKKTMWYNLRRQSRELGISEDNLEKSFIFKIATYRRLYRKPNLWLATSKAHAEDIICPMHRSPLADCVFGNFPRNSLLVDDKESILKLAKKYEPIRTVELIERLKNYNKVYIYMPTWRTDGHDFVNDSQIDFNKLNTILKINNAVFILNLHPATKLDYKSLSALSNIIVFDRIIDVYYILPFTDCLIADYSSVYTDYLIMNKEIILFPFDYNEYVKKSHDLLDYDKYYKGMKVYNFNDLLLTIESNKDCHLSKIDYDTLMDYYWGSINEPLDIVNEVNKKLECLTL